MTKQTAPESTFTFAPMSDKQREAFEALARRGTQPKAVNTAQALITRGLVEVTPDGDLALTVDGEQVAATMLDLTPRDVETRDEQPAPMTDEEVVGKFGPDVLDDETTEADKKAKAKTSKKAEPKGQTLRIPVQFADFLRSIKTATKATQSVLARVDNSADVDPKDKSVRIPVTDADLRLLLDHAKAMRQSASDASTKRVAIARERWIEKMLAAKA